MVTHHQVAHLIDDERVGPTAKRGELNQMHVIGLFGAPFGSLQDARRIGPLRDVVNIVQVNVLVTHIVVGDDVDAHAGNHVSHLMLDERIAMIGTTYKHDDQTMVVTRLTKHIFAEMDQLVLVEILGIDGLIDSLIDGPALLYAQALQKIPALLAQRLLILERDSWRNEFGHGTLHCLDDLAIATDDGAIETVLAAIGTLVDDERQEDAIDATFHQVTDVAVHKLGRETDVVAHHHASIAFVLAIIGRLGKDNIDACMREKGMPEGELLKLVQSAGNADSKGG